MKDKIILITGGTSGIGRAAAQRFSKEGARVIITGRHAETVNETVKNLGVNVYGIVSDASKMDDIYKLPQQVKKITAQLDILYVNAGYGKFAPIGAITEDHFDELFGLLVKGSCFAVQQLLPLIKDGGAIILNTSVVTETGVPNLSVYSAAKAAVQSMIKTFAAECLSRNIRVNGVSPGYIDTDGFNKTGLTTEQIDAAIESIIPTIPMKRFGRPAEVAEAVYFLASAGSTYINGSEIVIDGGLSTVNSN